MSQHEAAQAMGIHQTFLSHAELGYKRPHPDNLRVMARVLDGNFEQYMELARFIPAARPDQAMAGVAADLAAVGKVIEQQGQLLAQIQRRLQEITHKAARLGRHGGDKAE